MSNGRTWSVYSIMAGAGGGLVASIMTCPLDVLKTKLQAQHSTRGHAGYKNGWGIIRSIWIHDGPRGFYRGLGPTIFGYLPTWAIYFTVYDSVKGYFGEPPLGGSRSPPEILPAPSAKGYQPAMREHTWTLHILSAMSAGASSTICTNPLWVIKTRFMTQERSEQRYRHTLDAARTIYHNEGIGAFYRGLFPSLLGIVHVAVQFPLYEHLKRMAQRRHPDGPLSFKDLLLCTAISKMTASVTTYPHEVVRTRMQTQRVPRAQAGVVPSQFWGVVRTVKDIVRHEGWHGLYKGLSINLLRTVPNSAVTMMTYEYLMRELPRLTGEI